MDIEKLTPQERAELRARLDAHDNEAAESRREAYEAIKEVTLTQVEAKVRTAVASIKAFNGFVVDETTAFYEVMREYGALRKSEQQSFTIGNDKFKIEVKSCKVKKFDERADLAAERLIEFLTKWMQVSDKGIDDPMYQLAMMLLERNKNGDLDYKSISKLYELEQKFNSPDYSEIMQLFKESNIVEGTAINYYFSERTAVGVWSKLEPSFNRI